ncbi:MAG: hypothetical protein IIB17_10195, partial [Chloroflexi bacterium]|nr:hypothetical protein [Chloroflexota bacterium]
MADVTLEQLAAIKDIPTPAIANAIETFNIMPRNKGFMGPDISAIFPDMGNMIGYAVTGVIRANAPPSAHMNVSRVEWVEEILKIPAPRVIVLQDLDWPNPIGSFWGEVQANIHSALECVGTVTNGGGTENEYAILADATTGDLVGGDASGDDLLLVSTTDATKGDIQFHSTSYLISSTGDLTIGGRVTFENSEYIANETDDIIAFVGAGGGDNTDLYLDLDGTYPVLYSNTDTKIGIDDDLEFVGAQTISTSTGNLTLNPGGTDDVFFHGATYNISDTGDFTIGGRV